MRIIDDVDTAITGNITNVTLAHDLTPTIGTATSYTIQLNNKFYNPHDGHNKTSGGILSSTGFKISGDTTNEMFFDDDGSGNLRIYYIVAGVRVYQDETAGTVDYTAGKITVGSVNITTISNVDGASSSIIRITAVPDSLDVVPVRNQLLEIVEAIQRPNLAIPDEFCSTDLGLINPANWPLLNSVNKTNLSKLTLSNFIFLECI